MELVSIIQDIIEHFPPVCVILFKRLSADFYEKMKAVEERGYWKGRIIKQLGFAPEIGPYDKMCCDITFPINHYQLVKQGYSDLSCEIMGVSNSEIIFREEYSKNDDPRLIAHIVASGYPFYDPHYDALLLVVELILSNEDYDTLKKYFKRVRWAAQSFYAKNIIDYLQTLPAETIGKYFALIFESRGTNFSRHECVTLNIIDWFGYEKARVILSMPSLTRYLSLNKTTLFQEVRDLEETLDFERFNIRIGLMLSYPSRDNNGLLSHINLKGIPSLNRILVTHPYYGIGGEYDIFTFQDLISNAIFPLVLECRSPKQLAKLLSYEDPRLLSQLVIHPKDVNCIAQCLILYDSWMTGMKLLKSKGEVLMLPLLESLIERGETSSFEVMYTKECYIYSLHLLECSIKMKQEKIALYVINKSNPKLGIEGRRLVELSRDKECNRVTHRMLKDNRIFRNVM